MSTSVKISRTHLEKKEEVRPMKSFTFALLVCVALLTPAIAQENTSYRHGVIPMLGSSLYWERVNNNISSNDLHYRGGTTGGGETVGVTTGQPKVYLVFWGTQWGKAG